MSLFPLCQFVSGTAFATALRESDNAFPIVDTIQVLGITLLGLWLGVGLAGRAIGFL